MAKDNQTYHQQTYIDNTLRLRDMLKTLPPFARDYFRSIEPHTSSKTRISYAYDIRVFFQFLLNENPFYRDKTMQDLTVDDLDKVIALQNEIVEALPDKDLYATFTREESLGQLEHDICMMAECDGEVAGYSVMIPNDPDNPENYGKYFNYDREQLAKTVFPLGTLKKGRKRSPWTLRWSLLNTEGAVYSVFSISCVSAWPLRWELPKR